MHFSMKTLAASCLALSMLFGGSAVAMDLGTAVRSALDTNPEIGQALANREAIEFELKQALGLYAPSIDLEGSVGIERLNNPARRAAGIQNTPLYPAELGVVASYDLLDGGFRESEANRQAARIDGASFRLLERSELVGLEVARLYFEVMLQSRVVQLNRENIAFHEQALRDVSEALNNGRLTEADRQQAIERVAAAKASLVEAVEALAIAKIGFQKNAGIDFGGNAKLPSRVGKFLPGTEQDLVAMALINNPRVKSTAADIDAASALVDQASGAVGPRLSLEARASVGSDLSGTAGFASDVSGRLVFKWNIYDGGIKNAKIQENVRRETEAMYLQQIAGNEVAEAVRESRSRRIRQAALAGEYQRQLKAAMDLETSYKDQFTVGQRSLLDLLDAHNTRFNVQVLAATADYSARFAEYRLLAATGMLLSYLDIDNPDGSNAYARDMLGTPPADPSTPEAKPVSFSGPLDLSTFVN